MIIYPCRRGEGEGREAASVSSASEPVFAGGEEGEKWDVVGDTKVEVSVVEGKGEDCFRLVCAGLCNVKGMVGGRELRCRTEHLAFAMKRGRLVEPIPVHDHIYSGQATLSSLAA